MRHMTKPEIQAFWIRIYQLYSSWWVHDGNPNRPYAELTSALISDGFCNSKALIADTPVLQGAMSQLIDYLMEAGLNPDIVDCVVGPATGATRLAEVMCSHINGLRKSGAKKCRWISPVKIGHGTCEQFAFDDLQTVIQSGERALMIDDVATTGGSVERAAKLVEDKGGELLPFVPVLVNRSGHEWLKGRLVVPIISVKMHTWDRSSPPDFVKNDLFLRPKKDDNWEKLTREYPTE